jgi:hypothetical protein
MCPETFNLKQSNVDTRSSSALMYGQGLLVNGRPLRLQATTTEISLHMISQSYRKMYHWRSEHECGTCMLVLRAVPDVLSNTYHNRWIGRGGPTAWPPRSPDLNPLDFYLWGHLNFLVYAAPVDNEERLHYDIVRLPATASASLNGCGGP